MAAYTVLLEDLVQRVLIDRIGHGSGIRPAPAQIWVRIRLDTEGQEQGAEQRETEPGRWPHGDGMDDRDWRSSGEKSTKESLPSIFGYLGSPPEAA